VAAEQIYSDCIYYDKSDNRPSRGEVSEDAGDGTQMFDGEHVGISDGVGNLGRAWCSRLHKGLCRICGGVESLGEGGFGNEASRSAHPAQQVVETVVVGKRFGAFRNSGEEQDEIILGRSEEGEVSHGVHREIPHRAGDVAMGYQW
jgi:hypothetical protein